MAANQMKTKIQYTGTLSTDQLEALNTQLVMEERDTPLVFKGRSQILNRIEQTIGNLKQRPPTQTRPLSVVIRGAPGSGKTSLLTELMNQHSEDSGVTTIDINGKDLKSEQHFLRLMLRGVEKWKSNELTTKTTIKIGGGINVIGFRGDLSEEREYPFEMEKMSVKSKSVWAVLKEALGDDKVVLLCIDEAQTVRDEGGGARDLLVDFHTGKTENLRILPVFAGLNDTIQILADLGVSRLSTTSVMNLGSLSTQEAEAVVLDTLNHPDFGLADKFEEKDKKLIAITLGVASGGWPRHLHHYVQGLLLKVAVDQELEPITSQVDLDLVLEHGHSARIEYYEQRVSLIDRKFAQALMQGLSENPDKLTTEGLERLCAEQFNFIEDRFEDELNNAIHVGVINPIRAFDNLITVPIPSLNTFLVSHANGELTKQFLREQHGKELERELNRGGGLSVGV